MKDFTEPKSWHEITNIFPLLTEDDLNGLTEDIVAHGLLNPLVIFRGKLLDGRNRALACKRGNVTPTTVEWVGSDETAWVISQNLHRRHLNESQRAMVAARLATLSHGGDRSKSPIGDLTREQSSKLLGVGTTSIDRAKIVLNKGISELIEAVEQGRVAVSRAAEIAPQSAIVQEQALRRILETGAEPTSGKAHVSHNTGDSEWFTPLEYIKSALRVMGGIDLDPASTPEANAVVGAKRFFTKEQDGLTQPWKGRIWMNPPYAHPLIDKFCSKISETYTKGSVTEACILVNNATETGWFNTLVEVASAVCFTRGRVKFWHPEKESTTPLQGQAVIYLGKKVAKFRDEFKDFGWTAVL